MMILRLFGVIVILAMFIYVMDSQSAMYGNGVFTRHKKLTLGMGITTINQTYITSDQHWEFEGYIVPKTSFITVYDDTIQIEEIRRYSIHNTALFIEIACDTNPYWIFKSKNAVLDRNPIILESINENVDWINLIDTPFVYKYWKMIAYLVSVLILVFTGALFYNITMKFLGPIIKSE